MQSRHEWKHEVLKTLRTMAERESIDPEHVAADMLPIEVPPKPELGDVAFPMFPFAKIFRRSPQDIAAQAKEALEQRGLDAHAEKLDNAGPYLNVGFHRSSFARSVLETVEKEGEAYGRNRSLAGRKVMVEFSSPNTNKPLHLGHLRNDALGESVSRMLQASGAEVRKVNLINDRGIHICKSMLAYRKFGQGSTPESEGLKPDHFVGKYYVKFAEWAEEDETAEEQAQEMLRLWEQGDPDTLELWRLMNGWVVRGIEQTYEHTGVSFDDIYYESRTYQLGRDEIWRGLEQGVFYREEDGSVWVDLQDIGLDQKILLRRDGTSVYLTQDIGTAIQRQRDWPFDSLVYVVGSEQQYHFRVLFNVLARLGMEWAKNLYHLSYGMVNLPEGKMKSREGTVVDADDLIKELEDMAKEEIRSKEREAEVGDLDQTASRVALAALHYYLLQSNPNRDMIFDPRESLSFTGNTGPYLQYVGARISSMLRKMGDERVPSVSEIDVDRLTVPEEWELVKRVAEFPERVEQASRELNPAVVTGLLYELAKTFSRYYHEHPIVTNSDPELRKARLVLAVAVLRVLRNAFELTAIPFLETM
jgi:arginyl-tRNA synthetase